eukprot:3357444-Rhodomonas_salina.2
MTPPMLRLVHSARESVGGCGGVAQGAVRRPAEQHSVRAEVQEARARAQRSEGSAGERGAATAERMLYDGAGTCTPKGKGEAQGGSRENACQEGARRAQGGCVPVALKVPRVLEGRAHGRLTVSIQGHKGNDAKRAGKGEHHSVHQNPVAW